MKKIIAALLCALMLAAATGCSGKLPAGETATESANAMTEPVEETGAQQEESEENGIGEDMKLEETGPEIRTNPPEDRVFADITPFGNVAGWIVSAGGNESLLNWEEDTRSKQIYTSGEFIEYSIYYGFGKPVYVVDGYIEKIQALYDAVETVTGLTFQPRVSKADMSEMPVWVALKNMFIQGGHEDCDMGSDGVFPQDRNVIISQGSALLGKSSDPIAGLATVLQTDNAYNRFNAVYSSGFPVYTAYKVQKYLEEHDPELAMVSRDSTDIWMNYYFHNGSDVLYSQPMTYWIENGFPYEYANGSASVGFFFMMYLDEEYGDYCGWIPAYAQNYPCRYGNTTMNVDQQIQVMKDVYGESVLDDFYPWLKEKLRTSGGYGADYSWRKQYVYYPLFANYGYDPLLFSGKYDDMCISLAEYRNYMTEFKGYGLEELTLVNDRNVTVALYDRDGRFIMATKGNRTAQGEYRICMENVYYVQFVGKGTVCSELRLTP